MHSKIAMMRRLISKACGKGGVVVSDALAALMHKYEDQTKAGC